jgi:hypothetical protein
MNKLTNNAIMLLALALIMGSCTATQEVSSAKQISNNAKSSAPHSINVLEFGDNNILFAGDPKTGTVYAYETETVENPTLQYGYNVKNLDEKIATFLKVHPRDVLVKDMGVHPATKEAYIAVSSISGDTYVPNLVILNQSGTIRSFDFAKAKSSKIKIKNAPAGGFEFWDDIPSGELTFTDIDFHKGKLYVSGLSNSDFASTLRIIDYPFKGNQQQIVNVEIFHTNHGQNETRAPIRTLEIVELGGVEHLLAAYTCTPLVTIPLADLKDGAHVRGKTIAELGYGNTPIDLIQFTAQDMQQNKYDVVFLNNKNQMAQVIALGAIAADNQKDGLATFQNFKRAGTQPFDVPMTSILHVDEQDGYHLLTVRRNMDNGNLELISFMKNLYFRLSDFQSEFEFPDYEYPQGADFVKKLQNQMKQDEGFPKKVKE